MAADRFKDWLAKGVKSVVDDINRKWEEFVYGRTVSPRSQTITIDSLGEQKSLSEQYGWMRRDDRAQQPTIPEHYREPAAKEVKAPDRGIDL